MRHTARRLWRRISRRPEQTKTVELVIDHEPFSDALRRFAENWQQMQRSVAAVIGPALTGAAETIGKLARALSPYFAANEPVHVAGLEARYFVRAGLDPACAAPSQLDALVQTILTGTADDLRYVNDENRAVIAGSAIAGWCASYAGQSTVRVLAWHRQMPDGIRLSVGRAS